MRRPGPDVVRALAMAGVVVMNYHGYLLLEFPTSRDGALDELFDPWTGPFSTRFAATFVLTAGVGVTLMTRSAVASGDSGRVTEMRWRLVRRGLLLYGGGLLFDFVWPGTILPFYGAMFVVAASLFTLRSRWLLLVGTTAAIAGWVIRWWRLERELDGRDTSWLTDPGARSPRGLLLDVFLNGTHPLLPWLAFFCAGIVVGRMLTLHWWRPAVAVAGFVLFAGAAITNTAGSDRRSLVLLSVDPFDRGVVYAASALGTALLAFVAVSWFADSFENTTVIDALRRAGQMSLTIYLAHALVFNLVVDWLGLIESSGLAIALPFATIVWLTTTASAVAYQRRFGRGPAEVVYRKLTC